MGMPNLPVAGMVMALAAGAPACAPKRPPTNSIKASGTLVTNEGIGDLTVVFTPPDKFRIVGSHPLAGRVVDIGGDGDIIWVVTDGQTTAMPGRIIMAKYAGRTERTKPKRSPPMSRIAPHLSRLCSVRQTKPARATTHPERCRFCGSSEFWRMGLSLWHGVNRTTGERASGATVTVRCCKCYATFSAELADPSQLKWHLGH